MAYGDFLAKSLQRGRKHKVSFGCKEQIYPRETTIRGHVTCDLIYPCIHQHESEAESQGEAFRALFRD